jgi:hypothetical protein
MSFVIAQANTQFTSPSAAFILTDFTLTSNSSGLLSTLLAPHGPNMMGHQNQSTHLLHTTTKDRNEVALEISSKELGDWMGATPWNECSEIELHSQL